MYNTVIAVVEKGQAEKVIDAATEVGARGATIINARGSGIHETSKIFALKLSLKRNWCSWWWIRQLRSQFVKKSTRD